ncbi:MAG: phospho-N-acetylmuramoyl-pentapeptide-transferase [Schwartzia sp.]|nr:phospho-N-acetylmuramoyl-pentapeptide-transferase [Schwartzia sp. (in: firmicutes)]
MEISVALKAAIVSALVVLVSGPFVIPELRKLKFGQSIRDEGPKSHQAKSGTPTMGGVMILAALTAGALCATGPEPSVLLALFVTLGHGAIGFVDDYISVVKKRNLGLRPRQKLAAQIGMAAIVAIVGSRFFDVTTSCWIPFANVVVDFGVFYYPLLFFAMVGASNAVNLTDGLDGLATGTVAVAAICYAVVCVSFGKAALAAFCIAVASACLAFLRFNAHPAKVFMGDTGSLALGGALAAVAILTKTEFLLGILGGVFVIETLSVIIQVISFQTTGKRVFLMSPIHHHFELLGWPETKVVRTFWAAGVGFGLLALLLI